MLLRLKILYFIMIIFFNGCTFAKDFFLIVCKICIKTINIFIIVFQFRRNYSI